jgi:HlyD family secretion protein
VTDRLTSDLASLKIHRDAPPASSPLRKALVALVLVAGIGAGAFYAYGQLGPRVFKEQVAVTEVSLISPVQASVLVSSTGYVVPQNWSKIGAKSPGRLAQVLVKEGDHVKAGQVIATLDDADQKSQIATATSRVAVARARRDGAREPRRDQGASRADARARAVGRARTRAARGPRGARFSSRGSTRRSGGASTDRRSGPTGAT